MMRYYFAKPSLQYIAQAAFSSYDSDETMSYLKSNYINSLSENDPKLKRSIYNTKLLCGADSCFVGDGNIVFFITGGVFHNVEGIAITRNNTEPQSYYKGSYLDGGISYEKIDDNTYFFDAGL